MQQPPPCQRRTAVAGSGTVLRVTPTSRLARFAPLAARARTVGTRAAFRAEAGVTRLVAAAARRRGWSEAVLPYTGIGAPDHVRVLARVVLAAPGVEPSQVVGVAGWRRLLTLERPGTPVRVEVAGQHHDLVAGRGGFVDRRRRGPRTVRRLVASATRPAIRRPAAQGEGDARACRSGRGTRRTRHALGHHRLHALRHARPALLIAQGRCRSARQPYAPVYLPQQQYAAIADDVATIERRLNNSPPQSCRIRSAHRYTLALAVPG